MHPGLSTAIALDSVDSSAFEVLASAVLRRLDHRYDNLIRAGLTIDGRPVSEPFDGVLIEKTESGSHYTFFAYTTEKRARLKAKWLSEGRRPGDVTKALAHVKTLLTPGDTAHLVLATNRTVGEQLVTAVTKRCHAAAVTVDVLEFSRLKDFLDESPDGQWLRRKYLGIEQQRLSSNLLRELCEISISQYAHYLAVNVEASFVAREVDRTIDGLFDGAILGGASGAGKSVACFRALRRRLARGAFGLWIPGRVAAEAITLEAAIRGFLLELHPTLSITCAEDAVRIALDAGDSLLVVVDDLAAAMKPGQDVGRPLRALCGAARPAQADPRLRFDVARTTTVFVPIRDDTPLPANVRESFSLRTINIGAYMPQEARAAVRLSWPHGTESECDNVAFDLAYDPYLIGLIDPANPERSVEAARNGDLILQRVRDVALSLSAKVPGSSPADHTLALRSLAWQMLKRHTFGPALADINAWFEDSAVLTSLRVWSADNRILRADEREVVSFSHDRYADSLFVSAISRHLENSAPLDEMMLDPYVARHVGRACLTAAVSDEVLDVFMERAPLVLAHALGIAGDSVEDTVLKIRDRLIVLMQRLSKESGRSALLTRVRVSDLFVNIDSPHIREAVQYVPDDVLRMTILARHGDVKSVFELVRQSQHGLPDPELDTILRRGYQANREALATAVQVALSSSADEALPALIIAGRVPDVSSPDVIVSAALSLTGPADMVQAAIWAVSRHPDVVTEKHLGPLLALYESDSEEMQGTVDDVAMRFDGVPGDVIRYVRDRSDPDTVFSENLLPVLCGVDDPAAVEYCLSAIAEDNQYWDDYHQFLRSFVERNPYDRQNVTLSDASLAVLKNIWLDSKGYFVERHLAYLCWEPYGLERDLAQLRTLRPEDPLFTWTIAKRLALRDASILQLLPVVINVLEDTAWIPAMRHIWNESTSRAYFTLMVDFLERHGVGRSNFEHSLATLLIYTPSDFSEEVFDRFGDRLLKAPHFVEVAAVLGTPGAHAFVRRALAISSDEDQLMHVGFVFHQYVTGRSVPESHIAVLEPFLQAMSQDTLAGLALRCNLSGLRQWRRAKIDPLLSDVNRRRLAPTRDEEFMDLDKAMHEEDPDRSVTTWMIGCLKRGLREADALAMLREWSVTHTCDESSWFAFIAVAEHGTREDVAWVEGLFPRPWTDQFQDIFQAMRTQVQIRTYT